jgi:hypothetical protein
MDSRLVFPTFSAPPVEYDQRHIQDLVRSLDALVRVIKAPGEGRQTTIVLTDLQSNDYGLEPGTIFEVSGALRVSVIYSPYVAGLSATASVGSVTVSIDCPVPVTGVSATGDTGSVTVTT